MQFRLQTLFILVTLTSVVLATIPWHQARQRRLAHLVEAYNTAMDAQRYDDAQAIAKQAEREFPQEILPYHMCEKIEFVQALRRGEWPEFIFECVAPGSD